MIDRDGFVRDRMRRYWGTVFRDYAAYSAPQSARLNDPLLSLVAPSPGDHALDVATGPGALAIRVAQIVGASGSVVASDLAPEWEEIVRTAAAVAGVHNLTFRAMSAEDLDLPDQSFDLVACQLGLMFVPDRPRALGEMRRVLRPGGQLGLVVWSTADEVPLFESSRMVGEIVPPQPGDELMPTPLALGEPGLIERLVDAAGFREVVSERRVVDYVVPDAETHWQHLINRPDPRFREALAALSPGEFTALHDRVIAALEHYRDGTAIRFPNVAIFVRAVR
jgi:ubiquinone/menaquinone biosynthesis C-methylase UbiE